MPSILERKYHETLILNTCVEMLDFSPTEIEYDLEELTKEFDLWRLRSKHRRKQVEQGVSQHLATKHNDVISNINAVEFPKDASLTWDSLELLSQKHLVSLQKS